jgi:hypothetical protein
MNDIPKLQDVIRILHGCESRHVESVPVRENYRCQTVRQGTVEVFDLIDHPTANRCYAWTYRKDNGKERSIAVLELPPVNSAKKAVQVAIAAESRKK